jgi:hypothetical protein
MSKIKANLAISILNIHLQALKRAKVKLVEEIHNKIARLNFLKNIKIQQ